MIIDDIRNMLFELQDEKYREMQVKIIPNVDKDSIIGVRTPELRKMAKQYVKNDDVETFLGALPHKYFDENQLHAFIVSEMKDYNSCMERTEQFLPYINNWATCDQMSPKIFKKNRADLLKHIKRWIKSKETYTIRFGIGMLMEHFLNEDFDISYPELVAKVRSEEYYVNMMIAWYFATALAKQYDSVIPYIEQERLDVWTHNKAIQKSVESYRITPEQKDYLKTFKKRQ
ncbi:MAG: DNA alkylation repair protein [Eubacterium sp.]|nr:DNA alkylation repair protein [Eubacterium sp.]